MKNFVLSGFMLIAGASTAFSVPTVIDTAYNPVTGHNYFLLSSSDWLSAESAAVSLGGHLVTINNQAENDWLFNLWGQTRTLLIGLTDTAQEGTFVWTSGEAFTFSNWNAGEPNNAVGWGPGPENYVHMYAAGWGTPGSWNDYPGGAVIDWQPALHGVVEVPEPTIGGLILLGGLALGAQMRKRITSGNVR